MTHGRPQSIADVLAQLLARRGYARQSASADCGEAWREAAGPTLAPFTRPGNVRRGALEVMVANSVLLQEITFQKAALLERLQALLPDQGIRDLRFRIGTMT
jgi:predicted nucleic acid-binding Zn ribbon protein